MNKPFVLYIIHMLVASFEIMCSKEFEPPL